MHLHRMWMNNLGYDMQFPKQNSLLKKIVFGGGFTDSLIFDDVVKQIKFPTKPHH